MIMKKYLFIIAATALAFASCSDLDSVKKDIEAGNEEGAINFASFTQKATRAENSNAAYTWAFITHHANFKVWGYKNTEKTAVFNGDVVTAGGTSPDYTFTYSPKRYWDKAATTYHFYAAAPATTDMWTLNGITSDDNQVQSAGYFTTSSTLTGVNIQKEAPSTSLVNTFKGLADVDKLIAEPCVVNRGQFSQTVQLNFIHILSKLNITIQKDATKLANQTVKLVSFEVEHLNATGNFDEHLHAATQSGSNDRWTDQSGTVQYSAKTNWEITTDANYIIESLVIPQDAAAEIVALDGKAHDAELYATVAEYNTAKNTSIDQTAFEALSEAEKTKVAAISAISSTSKPYFKLVYTIQAGSNSAEQFTVYYNLATVFNQATSLAFNEGWQNTLNITISPDEIDFCANVAEWSTNTANPALTVQ